MNNVFIDTDVIIDFLADREPFSREAAILFSLSERKKVKAYTSVLTYSNLYYVLRRFESHARVLSKLKDLTGFINILKVDEQIVKSALQSGFSDFEDGLQYYCALDFKNIDAIITRNIKDYKESSIAVMTPGDFLKTI